MPLNPRVPTALMSILERAWYADPSATQGDLIDLRLRRAETANGPLSINFGEVLVALQCLRIPAAGVTAPRHRSTSLMRPTMASAQVESMKLKRRVKFPIIKDEPPTPTQAAPSNGLSPNGLVPQESHTHTPPGRPGTS